VKPVRFQIKNVVAGALLRRMWNGGLTTELSKIASETPLLGKEGWPRHQVKRSSTPVKTACRSVASC